MIRLTLLRLAAALWGLAAAFAARPGAGMAPEPGQLAGRLTLVGLGAHASFVQLAVVALAPFVAVLLTEPWTRRLAADDTTRAAYGVALACLGLAPALAFWGAPTAFLVTWPLAMLAALTALRRMPVAIGRDDAAWLAALVPALFLGLDFGLGLAAAACAAVTVLAAARAAVARWAPRRGGLAFALAPLAMLPIADLGMPDGLPRLPIAALWLGGSVLLCGSAVVPLRALRRAFAYAVAPLLLMGLAACTYGRFPPVVDLFEDGHDLLPASEMLRGELPYRDIVPGHGLVSDGGLTWAAMRNSGDDTYARFHRARRIAGLTVVAAVYFLALGMTGSPALALAAALLQIFFIPGGVFYRASLSLAATGAAAAAVRLRSARLFALAGGCAALAPVVSLEFGAYAWVALAAAVAIARAPRLAVRLAAVALGALAVAVPVTALLATQGVADDAVRVTLGEIAGLGEVYALGLFDGGQLKRYGGWPDVLAAAVDREAFADLVWPVAVLILATLIPTLARYRRRHGGIVIGAVWTLAAGLSIAERWHSSYGAFAAAALGMAGFALLRRQRAAAAQGAAWTLLAALVLLARPGSVTQHLVDAHQRRGTPPELVSIQGLPRAAGALFRAEDAAIVRAVDGFVRTRLAAGETWFDFANLPMLYYLFDRNCPIRQYEVPFFQDERLQGEVITRLRDPHVRAVLIRAPHDKYWLDYVPNETRAPYVARYLGKNFEPAYERDGVVFWVRRSRSAAKPSAASAPSAIAGSASVQRKGSE